MVEDTEKVKAKFREQIQLELMREFSTSLVGVFYTSSGNIDLELFKNEKMRSKFLDYFLQHADKKLFVHIQDMFKLKLIKVEKVESYRNVLSARIEEDISEHLTYTLANFTRLVNSYINWLFE